MGSWSYYFWRAYEPHWNISKKICLKYELVFVLLFSIKDEKFVELLTICQSLPGPTSTQLLTAISMYATSSFAGGMLAFVLFSLPAFAAMFSAVLFLQ